MVTRYRIGVIDDYRNEFAYIDYNDYGQLQIWNACVVTGTQERQNKDDAIHIFLNFTKVNVFKKRSDADGLLKQLMLAAPISLVEYSYVFHFDKKDLTS